MSVRYAKHKLMEKTLLMTIQKHAKNQRDRIRQENDKKDRERKKS